MRSRIRGYTGPADFQKIKSAIESREDSLRVALSKLKQQGLVRNKDGRWGATRKGTEYIKVKIRKLKDTTAAYAPILRRLSYANIPKTRSKNMVIAFDIPEIFRKKRRWLRVELVSLNFMPMQKSVWFGPAPLPREFIDALHTLHILKYIKFFKAEEYGIV